MQYGPWYHVSIFFSSALKWRQAHCCMCKWLYKHALLQSHGSVKGRCEVRSGDVKGAWGIQEGISDSLKWKKKKTEKTKRAVDVTTGRVGAGILSASAQVGNFQMNVLRPHGCGTKQRRAKIGLLINLILLLPLTALAACRLSAFEGRHMLFREPFLSLPIHQRREGSSSQNISPAPWHHF